MDKCYRLTALLLVCLVAVVESYLCTNDRGAIKNSITNLDLRLEFSSDTFSDVIGKHQNSNDVNCKLACACCKYTVTSLMFSEIKVEKSKFNKEEISGPISCLECLYQWSDWTDCTMFNGNRIRYRYKGVTTTSVKPTCCLPTDISITVKKGCTRYTGNWSSWSSWSECTSSGEWYRNRSVKCKISQSECLLPSDPSSFEISKCTPNPGGWNAWLSWSECTSSGERYRYRSFNCHSNQSQCLLPSNSSSFEICKCTHDNDSSSICSGKEKIKENEKRYTLSEIIMVAFGCFSMGVLLSALFFILCMKRTQQGCFSKHVKEVQSNSKQQSGPDLQFQTERVVVKKYDPKTQTSEDSKNENKSDETQYQSLNTNQIDNDQQTYDELEVKEFRSDRYCNQPSSGRLKQTGNDKQTGHMTNLQHKTEGAYEYSRDSDLGGHNYFILESKNISRESKTSSLGRPETYSEVGDEVRDTILGIQDEQSDAAHEYFVLEHIKNGHN